MDEWSASSNGATTLRLIGAPGTCDAPFHPDFTYPIFGEAETIYGYQGLSIDLAFASGSLKPIVHVDWKKTNENTSAKVDNVKSTLTRFLPSGTVDEDEEEEQGEPGENDVLEAQSKEEMRKLIEEEVQKDAQFRPMGDRVASWFVTQRSVKGKGKKDSWTTTGTSASASSGGDRNFEVYRCTKDTQGFLQYLRRFRIFTLFFIEAASYIDEEEPGWEFFILFERVTTKGNSYSYHFAGFTSLYRFWTYPDTARIRLSQFLILPPYQKLSLGTCLYTVVHDHILRRGSSISELTVEDPSEIFDRLRDGADLKRLLSPSALKPPEEATSGASVRYEIIAKLVKEGKMRAPLDAAWSESLRKEYKIAPRQWARLLEMILLLLLSATQPGSGTYAQDIKAYRLQVKARLYRHNRDVLVQMSKDERIRKLQETYENLLEHDYADLVGVDVAPFLGGVTLPGEVDDDENGQAAGSRRSNGHDAADGPARKVARLT
ncbi:acyl-CoA N-acyltransferase [Tilletiaria anomala UBC 951]|uniref:Histone acetyltransferase type B catalytic subunit n=1 Tax=Tilletiaria anomala (strain ATCC 24038 / CBS 436.72 / UBC 951) TaxID=1037660 RepID=A0A066WHB3_TILAU|nr:acyl-CoA N-acyltransferase [Tilletiaria anomala UBC 951]KDN53357.1 acyl-CoA N-acyltransferase [Tilletiaria anomala UBC 951]